MTIIDLAVYGAAALVGLAGLTVMLAGTLEEACHYINDRFEE